MKAIEVKERINNSLIISKVNVYSRTSRISGHPGGTKGKSKLTGGVRLWEFEKKVQ